MDKFLLALLSWVDPSPSLLFSYIFYLFHLLFQAKLLHQRITNDTNDNEYPSPLPTGRQAPLSPSRGEGGGEGKEIVVETIVNRVELDTSMKFK